MKYVLVTGATSGLGKEIAKALAEQGWYVFAAGRNENALNEITAHTMAQHLKLDITNQDSVDNAFNEVSKITDHLDALVNFSGVQQIDSLIEGDIDTINCMSFLRAASSSPPLAVQILLLAQQFI